LICYTKRVENKFKFSKMKKSFVVFGLVLVLFGGAITVSAQTSASSQSALMADLFALMADIGRAISALVEKMSPSADLTTPATDTSKTPVTGTTGTKTPSVDITKTPESADVFIKVVSPSSASERWIIGKTYEIKWEVDTVRMGAQQNPNFVSIYLVSPNSATKMPLWTVSPIVRNSGSYKWTVSKNVYPGEYQVAVEPYARPNLRATGSAFVIGSDVATPAQGVVSVNPGMVGKSGGSGSGEGDAQRYCRWIYMGNNHWEWVCRTDIGGGTAPIGGNEGAFEAKITNPSAMNEEVFVKGNSHTIKWESTNSSKPLKDVEYVSIYVVAGSDFNKSVFSISRKAYNDGDFRWLVPSSIASGVYRIVIQSTTNSNMKIASDEFSLVSSAQKSTKPTAKPVGGEQGDQQQSCCRWINMGGGVWQWVCGRGLCDSGGGS
jgi:hypothetical protein